MKAAVISQYGNIALQEVPTPELTDDNVLIRVKYASICGSDQHIFKGEFHPRTKLPLIAGHEFAGIIEAAGKNVKNFKTGDKVTVDPIIWCGKCPACLERHYPACNSLKLVGIDLDGGFAEYVSVPETMVYKVPSHISDEHAALVEVLSIGFHAISRAGLGKNDDLLIFGCGKVGQSILQAAKTVTTGKIFIADILEKRLAMASLTYPDIHTINIIKSDPAELIREATNGKGVDIAIEAVGHFHPVEGKLNPIRSCIRAIKGGGRVCVLGLGDEPSEVLMKELIWKEAQIIASRVSHGEFAAAIEALSAGKLKPEKMITGILNLEDAQKGFELLEKSPAENLKIMIKV